MTKKTIQKIKVRVFSNRGLMVLVAVFIVSILTASIGELLLWDNETPSTSTPPSTISSPEHAVSTGPILPESIPIRLRIPSISIDAPFTAPLGLETNGEVAVPDSDTEVGWYKHSPTPGEIGPAVILGHVDSKTGPAVFFYLGQLDAGDDIFVDRIDGTTAHFEVESLERPKQSEFPTDKVYGNINYAGLRLITCSGIYLRGTQRYTNNLVVYARLIE